VNFVLPKRNPPPKTLQEAEDGFLARMRGIVATLRDRVIDEERGLTLVLRAWQHFRKEARVSRKAK